MDQQFIDMPALLAEPGSSGVVDPATSESALASTSASARQTPFPLPASEPTQLGPNGIRFDFNEGARLTIPAGPDDWVSLIRDLDTGNVLFTTDKREVTIRSTKRYYIRFGLEIRSREGSLVFSHEYNATGRKVLITLPIGTLGDSLGWLPYAVRFAAAHQCKLTIALAERLISLFEDAYPEIDFITPDAVQPEIYYATYNIGLFFDDNDFHRQPTDFRHVGLHRTAGYILGVDPTEEPARIVIPASGRPIAEPYVVIAVQASTHAKKWNNPYGWHEVTAWLKAKGYRVICIDRDRVHGAGLAWTHIPHGVEDETGDRPLAERARWLRYADMFVGVSSGLSWLAWAAGCPVVLISGFTHPNNEFKSEERIINWHACNSCWNDVRHRFDHRDFVWCPRHKGSERAFECSRLITAAQVISALERILRNKTTGDSHFQTVRALTP